MVPVRNLPQYAFPHSSHRAVDRNSRHRPPIPHRNILRDASGECHRDFDIVALLGRANASYRYNDSAESRRGRVERAELLARVVGKGWSSSFAACAVTVVSVLHSFSLVVRDY